MTPPLVRNPGVRGMGSRGGGKQFVSTKVRAKRAASHPDKIRERLEAGEDPDDVPARGFIRLGKTQTNILNGRDDLSEWTSDELRRGMRRDKNGGWRGRAPTVVARQLHDEAIKRTFEDAQTIMREGLVPAVTYLTEIVKDESVEAKDRLKAVQMILDRVLGKPLERVEIAGESSPWQDAIVAAVVPIVEVTEVVEGVHSIDNQ